MPLLFRRRLRSDDEPAAFLLHMLLVEPDQEITGDYESDRAQFLGRGRRARHPAALENSLALSRTTGATLDPIFALRQRVNLGSRASTTLVAITLAADTLQAALSLAQRYQKQGTVDQVMIDRVFTQAQTQSERELRRLNLNTTTLKQMQQLLSLLLYPHQALRANPATLAANQRGQSGLWPFGISGDYPILLVKIHNTDELALLQNYTSGTQLLAKSAASGRPGHSEPRRNEL